MSPDLFQTAERKQHNVSLMVIKSDKIRELGQEGRRDHAST